VVFDRRSQIWGSANQAKHGAERTEIPDMAEIQLSDEQQQQVGSLISAIVDDADLRARLETDPRSVFQEYGLVSIFPEEVDLRVEVLKAAEVTGYTTPTGHTDNTTTTKTNHTDGGVHADSTNTSHTDLPWILTGGAGSMSIQIFPQLGTAR
jgi:hypothetical protein